MALKIVCPSCNGSGTRRVKRHTNDPNNPDRIEEVTCQQCNGTGRVPG